MKYLSACETDNYVIHNKINIEAALAPQIDHLATAKS
jgi:hypothetical protein